MKIYIFGNPDFNLDSLPYRILPHLQLLFPEITFEAKDPNEDLDIPDKFLIIDTVLGINKIKIFSDLKYFTEQPHLSLHDFDLGSHLKYLKKLGKLKKIKIIGIPPTLSEKDALSSVAAILRSNQL